MKRSLMILAAFTLASSLAWTQDGAALYSSRCASCHGATGERQGMQSLRTTSITHQQIADLITKGQAGMRSPHGRGMSRLNADQAAAIATFIETFKK